MHHLPCQHHTCHGEQSSGSSPHQVSRVCPVPRLVLPCLQDDALALQQCEKAVQGLRFPLIVKHFNG